jgi:hypothetical protein
MGMGPITWACLMLAIHQTPAREYFMDSRDFEIPYRIEAARRNNVLELSLYVSRDQGQTWDLVAKKAPTDSKPFVYRAPADGTYWFVVQEEDRAHHLNPVNPSSVKPNQRIVVDTQRPRIQVTAERQANGEVLAKWSIAEEHPDPQSLRLDYHTEAMRPDQWTPLPVDPQAGQTEKRFNPGSAGEVRVRVQMKDRAENVGQGEATIAAGGGTAPNLSAGNDAAPFNVIPAMRAEQPNQPGLLTSRQAVRPAGEAPALAPNRGAVAATPAALTSPLELNPAGQQPASASPPAAAPPAAPLGPVAASSDRTAAAPGFGPETARGALPPVKIVNKRDVKLDFEVAKVGPSGLGGADVYVTLNEGATWSRLPGELPVSLATAGELHAGPVRGSVTVQLPAEGTAYGFIVAVKSKAGLARPAPKPGEPPQVRIELDATPPRAELIRPAPDPSQRDTLVLAWTAVDRNLPSTPITLEWAQRKEGPWSPIGNGPLPNNGQYAWHLPDGIPSRVFLRLTVRDTAGNAAVAQTDKPELIDLSVPETSIIGVAPAAR